MKISEIKSDEVRNEAVRLAVGENGWCLTRKSALSRSLFSAFDWESSPQGIDFWNDLCEGTTPNTPELKLPEKNPSE
jgi:hypothetical protein